MKFKDLFLSKVWKAMSFSVLFTVLVSCSNELNMMFPDGPAGMSAYEVWVKAVENGEINWPEDRTDINNFFLYLKGEDGKDGIDGQDGKSAYELWVEAVMDGLENPHSPGNLWPEDAVGINDFWYYLTGADGKDGVTPNIGQNGNWWIDGEDTGIPAIGKDGEDGADGEDGKDGVDGEDGKDGVDGEDGQMPDITIGSNGNWWINGVDTGKPASGKDGANGTPGADGESAYELWLKEVEKGIEDPHNQGSLWPKDKTSISDFWEFLRGEDGKDGNDGEDGESGVVAGYWNVVAHPYISNTEEYVSWEDGSVTYKVYDKQQRAAEAGTRVKFKAGIGSENVFIVEEGGLITVKKEKLPAVSAANVTAQISKNGSNWEDAYGNTFVPARMKIRISIDGLPCFASVNDGGVMRACQEIKFKVQRSKDNGLSWENVSSDLGTTNLKAYVYEYDAAENKVTESELNVNYQDIEVEISDGKICKVDIKRKVVVTSDKISKTNAKSLLKSDYWGDYNKGTGVAERYVTVGFKDYCYGENPKLEAWVKIMPMQFAPLPEIQMVQLGEITAVPGAEDKHSCSLQGRFDVASIDFDLCFEKEYRKDNSMRKVGIEGYEYSTVFVPVKITDSDFDNVRQFRMTSTIMEDGRNIVVEGDPVSINNPEFKLLGTRVGSMIALDPIFNRDLGTSRSINFYPINNFGIIEEDKGLVRIKVYGTPVDTGKYSISVTKQDEN